VFADGRFGIQEWSEHPHTFFLFRPHEAFIRVMPKEAMNTDILSRTLKPEDLEFNGPANQVYNPVGCLKAPLCSEVHAEWSKIVALIRPRWRSHMHPQFLPRDSKVHSYHMTELLIHSKATYAGELATWHQWQWCLHDLQAFAEYHNRLAAVEQPFFECFETNTAFCSIFSTNPNTVKLLMVLGSPVWHIRWLTSSIHPTRTVFMRRWYDNPVVHAKLAWTNTCRC
jgi:hypothetical protein